MVRARLRLTLVLAGLLVLTGCGAAPAAIPSAPGFTVFAVADRPPAPRLTGELLGGGPFDLSAHAGEVVVLNFWASWCGDCVVEAPDLEAVYEATKADKVAFIGVNTRDARDAANAFVNRQATTYPSIFDTPGKVALSFAVPPASIPATVIIDRQGRVAATIFGYVLRGTLEPVVRQLAAESGDPHG